ncbi:Arogenate dehydratase/prephenate dehydratase 1 [Nymphaea thermarum]|nr:Arogenate dehydratase/prephenate dehydratase 1 [Nymphaea thermarum]
MALEALNVLGFQHCGRLERWNLERKRCGYGLRLTSKRWEKQVSTDGEWCLCVCRATLHNEGDAASLVGLRPVDGEPKKELIPLPRPLSVTDTAGSPSYGSQVRVAYQGVPGAYSEEAALKAYPQCEAVPCEEFEAAFKAVELWLVDKAVLPIENSVGGSIHRNYDLLLRHRLHIVGEVQMAVNHCLLVLPGVAKEELKRVLSHPQALSQCELALGKLGVIRENIDDTAGAAQLLRESEIQEQLQVHELHKYMDLTFLQKIYRQDDLDNITRFLILAREPIIPRTDRTFKTSIVFTLEEGPGVLFKALAVFALRDINLTKIESRPQRKRPLRIVDDSNNGSAKYFDYLFYIDFEASMAETRAQNALGHLQVIVLCNHSSSNRTSIFTCISNMWLLK